VFFLDADEQMTEGLKAEIDGLFEQDLRLPAYSVPRQSHHFGRRLRHGGWWPDRQTRLLNRLEASFIGAVHERVDLPDASVGRLRGAIEHYTHDTVASVVERVQTYSYLEAEEAEAAGLRRPSSVALWLSPLAHLMWRYIFRAEFLDGNAGFVEARLQAYYRHLILVRRREGPSAAPRPISRYLIPGELKPNARPIEETPLPFPTDALALGLIALLVLLPFHLVVKQILPEPLGQSWKEGVIGLLLIPACFRLRNDAWNIVRNSWLFRLAAGYGVLVVLWGLAAGNLAAALQGIHVDLTYVALAIVVLALPTAERFPAIVWSIFGAGLVCAGGAVAERLMGRSLFPSATLIQQYGQPEVYINGTHILRPYFTFDFPTGLGAYLAVATVLTVSLWITGHRLWLIPATAFLAVAMALTFSRGPWLGALMGLTVIAVLLAGGSLVVRVGAVAGAIAILVGSSLLTSGAGSAAAKAIRLSSSPVVRTLIGRPRLEVSREALLRSGRLVERVHLPRPSPTVSQTVWTFGSMMLPVLEEPPPARGDALLGYQLHIPRNAVLAWGIALNPRTWKRNRGDGVTFRIAISAAARTVALFARYVDPKNVLGDRHPFFFRFPLFAYAGDTVRINMRTDSGPREDSSYDWAGWLNPRIVTVPSFATLNRWPYESVPPISIERPLKSPGPYLASFVNWQGDESNADRVAAWTRTFHAWSGAPLLGRGPGSVDEAAVSAGNAHPLITESQFGKVLVETGIVGLLLWLALCAWALWAPFVAYRRRPDVERLAVLAALSCIVVCSLAFQVLEVKQIAAFFWGLVGLSVVAELSLRGVELSIAPVPVTGLVPAHAGRRLQDMIGRWYPTPAPVPLTDYVPLAVSGPPESYASVITNGAELERNSDHLGLIAEVMTTDDQMIVNERLVRGWELIGVGVANGGPAFILGRRRLREAELAPVGGG
jgi:O-Antigen ligase